MSTTHYLAVDLGAESGRVILGSLSGGRLSIEEIHRFPNKVNEKNGHYHWDLSDLQQQIFSGLEKAVQKGKEISGISTDSWGVDYVLLNRSGDAVQAPFCYRDSRTDKSPERLFRKIPFSDIYSETGIQFMAINTLFQFESHLNDDPAAIQDASTFLPMADYFNYLLSGKKVSEQSLASTTQIYNPVTKDWSNKLVSTLGMQSSLFPLIVPSATVLGSCSGNLAKLTGFEKTKIIATCSHDTGAAVAAVPAKKGKTWAYLSSGTWSLLGAELSKPILTEQACKIGFTNEIGVGETVRFLKNIAGLWIVQECRREWESKGISMNYDVLTAEAEKSGPAIAHIDVNDPRFVTKGDMPNKIAAFCRETNQPIPLSPGQIARTVFESLAIAYVKTLGQLEKLTNQKIEILHLVGGGSKNKLLNQLAANATGLPVVTGPVEATAIGNLLIQALALGHIKSLEELRSVVSSSFPTETYQPSGKIIDLLQEKNRKQLLEK